MNTIPENTPQKQCKTCKELKPATKEYFRGNHSSPDGFAHTCKKCKLSTDKRCPRCEQKKPRTTEYFPSNKSMPDSLHTYCKDCWNEMHRKKPLDKVPPGYKRCPCCKEIKPATAEHFRMRKTEFGIAPRICIPCARNAVKASNKKHKDRARLRYAIYYRTHHDQIAEWRNKNRIRIRAWGHNRRAKQRANGGTHTEQDIRTQYKNQKGKCYYCHKKVGEKYHVDHIIPVSRGGTNDPSNLVIACVHCNTSKRDKLPHEWTEGGRLL